MSKKLTQKNTSPPHSLTSRNATQSAVGQLTARNDVPFKLAFRYKLQNHYTFKDTKPDDLKAFQRFLDKVSAMTFSQVDQLYMHPPDTDDLYNGRQVYHYELSETFRIHGFIEGDSFIAIRIDPKHRFHK